MAREPVYVYLGEIKAGEGDGQEFIRAAMSRRRAALMEHWKKKTKEFTKKLFDPYSNPFGSPTGKKGSKGYMPEGTKATENDVAVKAVAAASLETSGDDRGKSGGVPGGMLPDAPGDPGLQALYMILQAVAAVFGSLGGAVAGVFRRKALSWPWKAKTIGPKQLAKGGCDKAALKIQDEIGGEIVHITPKGGAEFLGSVNTKRGAPIASNWRNHFAVRKGDVVYDRITGPEGMHITEYKSLWKYSEGIDFEKAISRAEVERLVRHGIR